MKLNLVNLHEGLNQLNFHIKPADIDVDENEETLFLFPNDTIANVEVQKFSDKYYIKVELLTVAHYTCDRCLEEFDRNLNSEFQLVYSKELRNQFEDDDYRFLGENTSEIDLSTDIRENLLLVIPMKHLCKEDCLGLCPSCGVNLNYETCECKQNLIDPRWEALKGLR